MRLLRVALAASTALALGVTTVGPANGVATSGTVVQQSQEAQQRPVPRLRIRTIVTGLDIPWDLDFLPSGAMLFTERTRERIWWRAPNGGAKRVVASTPAGVWSSGETGLMSLLVARNFKKSRSFWTCHGAINGGRTDVRVVRWRLNRKATNARRVEVIVKGIPANSGRHGGCRMRMGKGKFMYVGTGDAAGYRNPQNKKSLGGKVLRINPWTGKPAKGNPFLGSRFPNKRKVFTYGHRNVQGMALRANGQMWSVEHGSFRDDEVNRLRSGGNYGWDPGPGYNESAPMTDFSLPGRQIGAKWRSGNPTEATSGAVWMPGKRWGVWNRTLAVAALKDSSIRFLKFGPKGKFMRGWRPGALANDYGRLRSVVIGPGRALFVTTANGGGNDRILKVTPR